MERKTDRNMNGKKRINKGITATIIFLMHLERLISFAVILTIFLVIAGSIKWLRKLLSWSLGRNMLVLITHHKILIFIIAVFGILCIFVKSLINYTTIIMNLCLGSIKNQIMMKMQEFMEDTKL